MIGFITDWFIHGVKRWHIAGDRRVGLSSLAFSSLASEGDSAACVRRRRPAGLAFRAGGVRGDSDKDMVCA